MPQEESGLATHEDVLSSVHWNGLRILHLFKLGLKRIDFLRKRFALHMRIALGFDGLVMRASPED